MGLPDVLYLKVMIVSAFNQKEICLKAKSPKAFNKDHPKGTRACVIMVRRPD